MFHVEASDRRHRLSDSVRFLIRKSHPFHLLQVPYRRAARLEQFLLRSGADKLIQKYSIVLKRLKCDPK